MPGASNKPGPRPPRKGRRDTAETRATRQQRAEPQLPHERDQSSDSQQHDGDERVEQAARDLGRGLVDTDRGPLMDELARKHFPARCGTEPKRR